MTEKLNFLFADGSQIQVNVSLLLQSSKLIQNMLECSQGATTSSLGILHQGGGTGNHPDDITLPFDSNGFQFFIEKLQTPYPLLLTKEKAEALYRFADYFDVPWLLHALKDWKKENRKKIARFGFDTDFEICAFCGRKDPIAEHWYCLSCLAPTKRRFYHCDNCGSSQHTVCIVTCPSCDDAAISILNFRITNCAGCGKDYDENEQNPTLRRWCPKCKKITYNKDSYCWNCDTSKSVRTIYTCEDCTFRHLNILRYSSDEKSRW